MPNLFDIHIVFKDIVGIAAYIPTTLYLACASGVLGIVLGFFLAVIRIKKIPVLKQISGVFISMMRGTPIIVQLYVSYFGIPIFIKYMNYIYHWNAGNLNIPSIAYAIIALGLNSAAFNSINQGEIEAATALGMTGAQRMIRIILPEAIEFALPNLGNQLIGLVKGTSLAFTCAVVEMTAQGKIMGAQGYRYFEAYIALAILYWGITIVLEQVIRLIIHCVEVPEVVGDDKQTKAVFNKKRSSAGGRNL